MPKQSIHRITRITKEGDNLVIEYGPDTKLTLTAHIVEHSQHSWHKLPPVKEIRYVEQAHLQEFGNSITTVFDEGGSHGRIAKMTPGISQQSLVSHWSFAAAHIRGTDLPEDIKQIIAKGDHMLDYLVDHKLKAPAPQRPNPVRRLTRAIHLPHRQVAH